MQVDTTFGHTASHDSGEFTDNCRGTSQAKGSTTWKNAMIIAANLYTDQLESAGARLRRTLCNL
jgi:hypothetical protein